MNVNTFDRYAHQPPRSWIGLLWSSTRRGESGEYDQGMIVDVAPGHLKIRWCGRGHRPEEWVPRDCGTLVRPAQQPRALPGPCP